MTARTVSAGLTFAALVGVLLGAPELAAFLGIGAGCVALFIPTEERADARRRQARPR